MQRLITISNPRNEFKNVSIVLVFGDYSRLKIIDGFDFSAIGRGVCLSKYELVCRLSDSSKAREVLGDRVYVKLQAYRANGPYYAGVQDPQVAVERD